MNKNAKSKNKKNNILKIIILFLLIILLTTICVLCYNKIKSEDSAVVNQSSEQSQSNLNSIQYNGKEYIYNSQMYNILFLGVDKKGEITTHDVTFSGQSDCIMILSLNRETKSSFVLQISRDTMASIDIYDYNGNYLNTKKAQLGLQYAYGNGKETSCWATKRSVSRFLYDLPIDGYIAIDIDAISILNDELGGITLTVPKDYTEIDDEFIQGKTITLTGQKAERYIRYRDTAMAGSNNDRMERQVQYAQSLMSVFKNKITTIESYKSLYSKLSPYMVTDLSIEKIEDLIKSNFDIGSIHLVSGKSVLGEKYDEFYVDEEQLKKLLVDNFYKENK